MYVAQSLIFALAVSVLVTLFGLNVSNYLLGVMGSDAAGNSINKRVFRHYFLWNFYCTDTNIIKWNFKCPR